MVRRKWYVPVRYQLPKDTSVGLALEYFWMIDRIGWYVMPRVCTTHVPHMNMSCPICECVMSHICICHVTRMHWSVHTHMYRDMIYWHAMSRACTSHVPHLNAHVPIPWQNSCICHVMRMCCYVTRMHAYVLVHMMLLMHIRVTCRCVYVHICVCTGRKRERARAHASERRRQRQREEKKRACVCVVCEKSVCTHQVSTTMSALNPKF